jgi:hypothetical protein
MATVHDASKPRTTNGNAPPPPPASAATPLPAIKHDDPSPAAPATPPAAPTAPAPGTPLSKAEKLALFEAYEATERGVLDAIEGVAAAEKVREQAVKAVHDKLGANRFGWKGYALTPTKRNKADGTVVYYMRGRNPSVPTEFETLD